MKNIILLSFFLVVSACSKSSNENSKNVLKQQNVIQYEEINMSFSGGVLSSGSSFNYGDIPTGTTVVHDIIISNSSSSPLPAVTVNSSTSGLTYSLIAMSGSNCAALARGKKCTVRVSYVAPATVPTPNPIAEEIVINNSIVAISGNVIPSQAPVPSISVPALNLGTYAGEEITSTFQIVNQEMSTIPAPGLVFDTTGMNPDFTLDYSSCQVAIASRKKCSLTISYSTVDNTSGAVSTTFKIFDKEYTISVIKDVPDVEKLALTNYNPSSGLLDFGNKEQEDGLTPVLSMTIRNLSGFNQTFATVPTLTNFILESNGCASVGNRKSCVIRYKFNSNGKQIQEYTETFLMENDKYKIEFDLRVNVIANADAPLCDMTNSFAGGGVSNANNAVLSVTGLFPLCTVTACQPLYNIAGDAKSCEPVTIACTSLDATANGVNFLNSNNTVEGNVIAGDISQCLLSSSACNLNYVRNVNGKTCDGEIRPCLEADAVANGVNISNVDNTAVPVFIGNVVAGNTSQCLINSCALSYTKALDAKSCIQDSRPCIASDVTSIGGNITNALTYSGNVLLNDASSCRIATCSGSFEPALNGLSCENKTMTNLTFTITNKNASGYIKDSFAQLAINTVNALEMKISDNTTCSLGTWEPFASSKQFTIPAGRLNSTDAPISIMFRRNAITSACVHVTGAISLATSHLYRHDNIAPTPLTITTPTENFNTTASSISFTGSCMSGVNRETGFAGQTLQTNSCTGSYTSQTLSLPNAGSYALYIRQVDLAGNIAEVTRNIRRITSCTTANATSGGVRSLYGIQTVTGNLTDGCTITACASYTTIAGDAKECVPKDVTNGSFIISNKNANGYVNSSSITLASISSTNAQTFDIFENSNCSAPAVVSDRAITTSTSYSATTFNHSTDQSVSIRFKNGSKTFCAHVPGAITLASANTYRHDSFAPAPLTITTTLIGNGQTITSTGTTSVTFTGSCDTNFALNLELQSPNTQYPSTCVSGTYSRTISPTFSTDGTYSFRAYQTDLAGNVAQQFYTIYRDTKRTMTVNFGSSQGTGSVVSSPAGINCPSGLCSAKYSGAVTLTATPSANSSIASWSVSGATAHNCTGTVSSCSVTVGTSQDVFVTVIFNLKPTFALNVSTAGSGTGSVTSSISGINCPGDCSEVYYQGQTVTLTATTLNNSSFGGWSGGGCSGTSLTCVISISAITNVTATFTPEVCSSPTESLVTNLSMGGAIIISDDNYLYTHDYNLNQIVRVSKTTHAVTNIQLPGSNLSIRDFVPYNGNLYLVLYEGGAVYINNSNNTATSFINPSGGGIIGRGINAILGSLGNYLIVHGTIWSGSGTNDIGQLYYINSSSPTTLVSIQRPYLDYPGTSHYSQVQTIKKTSSRIYAKSLIHYNGPGYPGFREDLVFYLNGGVPTYDRFIPYNERAYIQSFVDIGSGYSIIKAAQNETTNGYSTGIEQLDSFITFNGIADIKKNNGFTYTENRVLASQNDLKLKSPDVINYIGNPIVIGSRIYGGYNDNTTYPDRASYARFCSGVYNLEYQTNTSFSDVMPQCFTLYDGTFTSAYMANENIFAEWVPPSGFTEFNGQIYFAATYGTKSTTGAHTGKSHAKKIYRYTPGGGAPTAIEATPTNTRVPYFVNNENNFSVVVGDFLYFVNATNAADKPSVVKISKTNVASTVQFNGGAVQLYDEPMMSLSSLSPEKKQESIFTKFKNEGYFLARYELINPPTFIFRASLMKIDINGNVTEILGNGNISIHSKLHQFDNRLFYIKTNQDNGTSALYKMQCN